MTEATPASPSVNLTEPVSLPASPPQAEPAQPSADQAARVAAIAAARAKAASQAPTAAATAQPATALPAAAVAKRTKPSGPAPSRIVAAATSVAAGIGLVALMAGAQQDVVVQVNPTPVTVQPASIIVEMPSATGASQATDQEIQVRVVEPATPAERPAPQAKVVTQSEGS